MKRSLLFACVLGLISANANALDMSGVNVNGEAHLDYVSFGNGVAPAAVYLPFSGAAHDQFNLSQAQIRLSKDTEKLSFFGQLFWESGTTTITDHLYRLEIFYRPMTDLAVGGGRLLTTLGFESVNRSENKNYSNTLAFTHVVPTVYEGVRVRYAVPEVVTANASVYNRALNDNGVSEDNKNKAYELSASGKVSMVNWFLGTLMGQDMVVTAQIDRKVYNAWVSAELMENLTLGVSYDHLNSKSDASGAEDKKISSISAVLGYVVSNHALALRYETVSDDKHLIDTTGTAEKFDAITLTDKIGVDENLDLVLEYRMDSADKEIFTKSDGSTTKTANAFIIGASARF